MLLVLSMIFVLLPIWGLMSIRRRKDYAQLLRLKCTNISNSLICTGDIVAQLFENGVITEKERDDIQQLLSTPIRANEQLLNTLMTKDDLAIVWFLSALVNTGQKNIANSLMHGDTNGPMKHSLIIQRNYTKLIENLDVDSGHLLDRLYQAHAITGRDMANINTKPTKYDKSQALLDLVSKFSPDNFQEKFMKALKESSQNHVCAIFKDKYYMETECDASISTANESNVRYTDSKLPKTYKKNKESQTDSNHDVHQNQNRNIRHSSTNTPSSLVRKITSKTMNKRFVNLPDELQKEISLKVFLVHQKTKLPSDAGLQICFRKLVKAYVDSEGASQQQRSTVLESQLQQYQENSMNLRKQNEGLRQDLDDSLRLIDERENYIKIINDELHKHRNQNDHLDESLKTKVAEFESEKQRNTEIEKQLQQKKNELVNHSEKIDGLLKAIDERENDIQVLNDELLKHRTQNDHLDESLKTKVAEFESEKQRNTEIEKQLQQKKNELVNHSEKIDGLLKAIDERENDIQVLNDELLKHRTQNDQLDESLEVQQMSKENDRKVDDKDRDSTKRPASVERSESAIPDSGNDRKRITPHRFLSVPAVAYNQGDQLEAANTDQRKHESLRRGPSFTRTSRSPAGRIEYTKDPLLITEIKTKESKDNDRAIQALAILDAELFIMSQFSSDIEVYNNDRFILVRQLEMKILTDPIDMVSCQTSKFLYIMNRTENRSTMIIRFSPNGKVINEWSTGCNMGRLSITQDSNIFLAACEADKIIEYTPEGEIEREIKMHKLAHPQHAIRLGVGSSIVIHRNRDNSLLISLWDTAMGVLTSFSGERGSDIEHLCDPLHLAVDKSGSIFVAQCTNGMIFLLNKSFRFLRVILSNEKNGLRSPRSIHLDEANGRLLVVDNHYEESSKSLSKGRVLVFGITSR